MQSRGLELLSLARDPAEALVQTNMPARRGAPAHRLGGALTRIIEAVREHKAFGEVVLALILLWVRVFSCWNPWRVHGRLCELLRLEAAIGLLVRRHRGRAAADSRWLRQLAGLTGRDFPGRSQTRSRRLIAGLACRIAVQRA